MTDDIKILCPMCGKELEICGGPERWTPTFSDPDSGGDPYHAACECGFYFSNGACEYADFITALNRRAKPAVTDQRINEMQARCEAATPGPWHESGMGEIVYSADPYGHGVMHVIDIRGWGHLTGGGGAACAYSEEKAFAIQKANEAFIAHSREDLPWALEQIVALKAEIERLTEAKPLTFDEVKQMQDEPVWMQAQGAWVFIKAATDKPYRQIWYRGTDGGIYTILFDHNKFFRRKPFPALPVKEIKQGG